MTPSWIAEKRVIFVHPDGERRPGRIAVGLPVMVDESEGRCAVSLEGLSPDRSIAGEGDLQALLLALRLAGVLLHDFLVRGGRVLDPRDDSEVQLSAIFGPLLASGVTEAPQ